MRLADFKDGIVPGVQWPACRKSASAREQIQKWIDAGLLLCPGNAKPDPIVDQLFYVEPKSGVPAVVEHSWPYKRGMEARKNDEADNRVGHTQNPLTYLSGQKWQAGYDGLPEPLWETKPVEDTGPKMPPVPSVPPEPSPGLPSVDRPSAEPAIPAETDIDGAYLDYCLQGESEPPPHIDSLEHLRELCMAWSADHEFWRLLAMQAASQMTPVNPVDWKAALEALDDALLETARVYRLLPGDAEKQIVAEFNQCFDCSGILEEEDDMPATKTKPKKPGVRGQGSGVSKSMKAPADVGDNTDGVDKKETGERAVYEDVIQAKPASWFTKSPYDRRHNQSAAELKELVDSIRLEGQINLCLARPNGEHIAGWRRVQACKLLGIDVQVRIVHCDDLTARRLVLIENAKRTDLTEREQCAAYNELLAEYVEMGRTQTRLAKDLCLDHSTLSNKLRLKSLTDDVWDRYESGVLSLDHIRQIATHAMVPGFADAVVASLDTSPNSDEQPNRFRFVEALAAGFHDAYRPMSKGSCEIKVTPAIKAELGVVEVDHPRLGKIEVASNVDLWEELNKQATEKKSETKARAEARTPTPEPAKPDKAAAKAQKERAAAARTERIVVSWCAANAAAIRARFEKPRKSDLPALTRLTILAEQMKRESDQMQLDTLLGDEEEFADDMRSCVSAFFAVEREQTQYEANWQDLSLADLQQITAWLETDPCPWWRPVPGMLNLLTPKELVELRDELELPVAVLDADHAELAKRCLDAWEPGGPGVGWCPGVFSLT